LPMKVHPFQRSWRNSRLEDASESTGDLKGSITLRARAYHDIARVYLHKKRSFRNLTMI